MQKMPWVFAGSLLACSATSFSLMAADALTPEAAEFRDTYRELVEINTTLSVGDCTQAAKAMAMRLTQAGYADTDLHLITPADFPKQGNLVATLPGADPSLKALLLLAHIDVVEALAPAWKRDPFKLIEEGGYFYGRGTADDKSMAAIFVDTMVRFKKDGYQPRRSIKLALTCGEETPNTFNGVRYLIEHHRELIDSAFALNEGAGGRLNADGSRLFNGVQAGEKIYQDFQLEVINPGGHSSRPVKDNAINRLAAALLRIEASPFPIEFNDTTRAFLARRADLAEGQQANDLRAIAKEPPDAQALERAIADPSINSVLRTTCVATQLAAGHAPNALPMRASANINCRILPGHTQEDVRQTLTRVIADEAVKVTFNGEPESVAPPPPLNPEFLEPIESITEAMWPGVPVIPMMAAGATDARFLTPAGIPTYGVSGIFSDPATTNAHGLNERVSVQALYEGRIFLMRLIRAYVE